MTGHLKLSQIDEAEKFRICFRNQKDNLKQVEAQEEQRLIRDQKDYLELEIRKFRRKKLLVFHNLEQELLRELLVERHLDHEKAVVISTCLEASEKDAASLAFGHNTVKQLIVNPKFFKCRKKNKERVVLRDLSLSSPHTPSAPLIPQSSEKVAAHPPDKEGDRENKERIYKGQQLEHAGPTARL
uniref:non-specific serine/threonine protein kinase n=1 Tax=Timema poppense TaxID=170557 RepID=A0A7R9CLH5_TIMPO|nr:unnamed protein product [Timema poppensis]